MVLKEYHDIIQKQFEGGVIEKCAEEETIENPVHYLPHRAVVKEEKSSSKVRIVYN